jgi:hypothetical protein
VVTFYPASGRRAYGSGAFVVTGSYGFAWSCAVTGANGYRFGFTSSAVDPMYFSERAYGFPVRCVQYLQQTF